MRTPKGNFYVGTGAELVKKLRAGWALGSGMMCSGYHVRRVRKDGTLGNKWVTVSYPLANSLPRHTSWLRIIPAEHSWSYDAWVLRKNRRAQEICKRLLKLTEPPRRRVRV